MPRRELAFYERRGFVLCCICGAVLYHQRAGLRRGLERLYRTAVRALSACETTTNALARTSRDLEAYLQAPPSATGSHGAQQVPRSIRRLLRVAASPEGLVMLRSIAAGAAGVAMKELGVGAKGPPPDPPKERGGGGGSSSWMDELVRVGLTSGGSRLIGLVVAGAVREAVSTVLEFQAKGKVGSGPEKSGLEVVMEAALSERGQRVIVQVAKEITRVAVPLIVQGGREYNKGVPSGLMSGVSGQSVTGGRRRPLSARVSSSAFGRSPGSIAANSSVPASPSSPRSRKLLLTALAMSGQKNWIEKLIVLASRDPGFIHDVIRTVASEAIRAYLTTQAELKLGKGGRNAVAGARGATGRIGSLAEGKESTRPPSKNSTDEQRMKGTSVDTPTSLWKVLVKSMVVDVRDTLTRFLENPPEARWLFM